MREGNIVDQRFRIARLIGKGGMGEVYRGIDIKRAAAVAIKISRWSDGASVQRFMREAEALSRLDHERIVRYVAHGLVAARTPYLVVEWLEGEDLGARLARGRLSVAETLSLGVQVAETLDAIHGRGILHLDIKPGNLFLTDGDIERVKLLDFGHARVASVAGAMLPGRGDELMGTRGYIPPEQTCGHGVVDERADLYSLGVVLYSCLAQRPPFLVSQALASRVELLFESVPRVSAVRGDVPAALDALIARLMDANPAERPPSARAVADELRGITPVAAPAAVPPQRSRHWSAVVVGRQGRELDGFHLMVMARRYNATLVPSSTDEALGALLFVHGDHTAATTSAVCCATELRALFGYMPLALATGEVSVGSPVPASAVLDRAVLRWQASKEHAGRSAPGAPIAAPCRPSFVVETAEFTPAAPPRVEQVPSGAGPRTWAWLPRFVPFLGRKPELDFLALKLEQTVDTSSARSLLITGDAGMGKTRLAHEFMRRARSSGARIVTTVGDPMRAGVPCQLVRRLAPQPGASAMRLELGADDAGERAARLRAWMAGEAATGPLLLVIDDAQWADRASMRLLDAALRDACDLPVLALLLSRPSVYAALDRHHWPLCQCPALRLSPLTDEACEALMRRTVPRVTEPELRRLIRGARGNALHFEELVGRYAAGIATAPDTPLADLIQEHLVATLGDADWFALQIASTLGRVFRLDDIQAALGRDRASTCEIVGRLIEHEVIARDWRSGATADYEYGFVSPLVYEVSQALFDAGESGMRRHSASQA